MNTPSPYPRLILLSLISGMAALGGCEVEPETLESLQQVANRSRSGSSSRLDDDFLSGSGSKRGEIDPSFSEEPNSNRIVRNPPTSSAASKNPDETGPIQGYQGPYGDRKNPFEYPGANSESFEQQGTSSVADIVVLGFANLGEKRVLLRTRTGIKSLATGDQTDGVTVIRINDPAVELKLGTLVWTTTMFDHNRTR